VVVIVAVLVALFVSGVFGGDEPASTPHISAPSSPTGSAPAKIVAVPGAKEATADEVELAKARDRARARGETLPADTAKHTSKTTSAATSAKPAATAGATAPAPAATTPPAAPPPPPPPAAATTKKSGRDGKRIDAGSGATGAEQIPPATDTSDVPELAPPPESAPAP
jgi:hypothetical protein